MVDEFAGWSLACDLIGCLAYLDEKKWKVFPLAKAKPIHFAWVVWIDLLTANIYSCLTQLSVMIRSSGEVTQTGRCLLSWLNLVINPWFLPCKRMLDTICDTKARGKQWSKDPMAAGNIVDNAHSHMSVALKCLDHIFMVAGDMIIYWLIHRWHCRGHDMWSLIHTLHIVFGNLGDYTIKIFLCYMQDTKDRICLFAF